MKDKIIEALSWTWAIGTLCWGLYLLTERNNLAIILFSIGAPMFRPRSQWARVGYYVIAIGLLLFCLYASCSRDFWVFSQD